MSDKYYFADKYRIQSNRMQWFVYMSWCFFVTICTDNREHYFGKIVDGEMMLNDMGNIVNQCRINIPKHFPNITVDEFVVMPNHVHWILLVNVVYDNGGMGTYDRDVALQHLYDHHHKPLSPTNIIHNTTYYSKISPKKWELWTVIRSYKSACTYMIKKLHIWPFHRQSNYYDNIIRNEEWLDLIRKYIKNNPKIRDRDRNKK